MAPQMGASAVIAHVVGPQDTARALGSGDLEVLATPRLVAWFEQATVQALSGQLDGTSTSVGTRIDVTHERAAAIGTGVTVRAELGYVEGRLLRFDVVAHDDASAVLGHGQVTRVVVDRERFLARL